MITVEDLSNLGPALKDLRQNVRMTQGEVCALAGLKSSQLSRWENGHEKPTLESVVKVLAALGRDLGDLQDILAGTHLASPPSGGHLNKLMAGDSGHKREREQGERVRAAYLGALRARGEVARLDAEGIVPLEDRYMAADRAERAALLKLLTVTSGQFIDGKEGYFARLSVRDLWAHFRILERRLAPWVTADVDEAPDTLVVPRAEGRWGRAEIERSRLGGKRERAGESQAELLRALERRLREVEERLDEVEDSF